MTSSETNDSATIHSARALGSCHLIVACVNISIEYAHRSKQPARTTQSSAAVSGDLPRFPVLEPPSDDYAAVATGLSTNILYSRASKPMKPIQTAQITIVSQPRLASPTVTGNQAVNSRMIAAPAALKSR